MRFGEGMEQGGEKLCLRLSVDQQVAGKEGSQTIHWQHNRGILRYI